MIQKKDIHVLGFGGWQLGNVNDWDGMTEESGIQLVQEAYKQGINFFDTAPGYGKGKSETLMGEALKDIRNNVWINTKFGHNANDEFDFATTSIEGSIKESCKRLQTTYLDSILLHNPEFWILEGKTDHFKELERLKQEGLIRYYGVSIDTPEEIEAILKLDGIDFVEILFNAINQSIRPYLPRLEQKGIGVIIKVPLDSGWLSGKYNENSTFDGIRSRWDKKTIKTRAMIVNRMKEITNEDQLVGVALSFLKKFSEITTIIPGIKNQKQLKSNIEAINYPLSNKTWNELKDLYDTMIIHKEIPW